MKYRLKITWRDGKVTYSGEMETFKEIEDFSNAISGTAAILWADWQESANYGIDWRGFRRTSSCAREEFADLQRRVLRLELLLSGKDERKS